MKPVLTLEDRIACMRKLSASAATLIWLVASYRKLGGEIDASLEPGFEALRAAAREASAALNGKNYDEDSTD